MPMTRISGKEVPHVHHGWICVGHIPVRASATTCRIAHSVCRIAATVLHGRVERDSWVRYHIRLSDAPEAPSDVCLTPLTDELIDRLRRHADHRADQLRSGLRFWDHGLRHAYLWMAGDEPLCVQWLLTPDDESRMRTLPHWSGMYPPLPSGCGQVENLYTFSGARRKGVATQFEHALFQLARRSGLRHLTTHIHGRNTAARDWADRAGWQAFGSITRTYLDVPMMRSRSVCVHDVTSAPATRLCVAVQCEPVREAEAL
jgi:GNAT superfamily N-acetyltransferase